MQLNRILVNELFIFRVPIPLCKILGRTTAQYRWFALTYLVFMFFLLPLLVMLSSLNKYTFIVFMSLFGGILVFTTIINVMQSYKSSRKILPEILQTWDFLPLFMHSLEPYDRYTTSQMIQTEMV